MRAMFFILAAVACDATAAGRPGDPPLPSIHVPEDSTGAPVPLERLDLPPFSPDFGEPEDDSTSTGESDPAVPTSMGGEATSTEPTSTGDSTTSETGPEPSTSDGTGTTTGDASTSGDLGSTGGDSTGEPEPEPVCGDGTCSAPEIADGCFAPGWCSFDCVAHPYCLTPCPCSPEAAEVSNVCGSASGACPAVAPGGYCDPDGDGDRADGNWTRGWQEWTAKCG